MSRAHEIIISGADELIDEIRGAADESPYTFISCVVCRLLPNWSMNCAAEITAH